MLRGFAELWGWFLRSWGKIKTWFFRRPVQKIAIEFLTEVAVLTFVFPLLDIMVQNQSGPLTTKQEMIIGFSLIITIICLLTAVAIASNIIEER